MSEQTLQRTFLLKQTYCIYTENPPQFFGYTELACMCTKNPQNFFGYTDCANVQNR